VALKEEFEPERFDIKSIKIHQVVIFTIPYTQYNKRIYLLVIDGTSADRFEFFGAMNFFK
jgi:hypothetical protein